MNTPDRLYELLFEMMRKFKQQMNADCVDSMSYLHLETLRFIREAEAPDMGAVADYLRVAAPSATAFVNALVEEEYVSRKPDPADRRRVMLAITPKGVRALSTAAKRREAVFARMFSPLSAADRREMARILTIITKR